MKHCLRILIPLLLLFVPVQADQQGVIVRQAPVYADANSASKRIGRLSAGTAVTLLDRDGGWRKVDSSQAGLNGWVRIYQVRAGSYDAQVVTTEAEDSRGFLSGLAAWSRKASGFFTQDSKATSAGTATIGVRGLSETEIVSAEADYSELEKLKKYASKPPRTRRFAAKGGLAASKIAYISGFKE